MFVFLEAKPAKRPARLDGQSDGCPLIKETGNAAIGLFLNRDLDEPVCVRDDEME